MKRNFHVQISQRGARDNTLPRLYQTTAIVDSESDREHGNYSSQISYCLSSLGCLNFLDAPEDRNKLKVILQNLPRFPLQQMNNLGYGNFHRVEILLAGSQQLDIPEFQKTARKLATYLLTKAEQTSFFCILPNLHPDIYNPAFLTGMAGIGYELLRLEYPDLLPSIILRQS
ncbi:hypothetical protein H1P_3380006 [Hyella patelloides LEGE 07179]|uniref:Uncharacterized protein n=2 Tax=Hyella TaxID=945733 RepID=A0A563VVN5_9CYAN|nr:hypothetical protein H1P_3380006 [Hyella patelloides LEGE 07179]